MRKSEMLESLIAYYTDGNKARFAQMIGAKPQTISAWITRDTFDAEQLYANCKDLSGDWLLSGGYGDMIRSNRSDYASTEVEKKRIALSLELADVLKKIIDLNK